jgi:hypothetical protein
MNWSLYDIVGSVLACAIGCLMATFAVSEARREPAFLTHRYLTWLGALVVWAAIIPFLYMWQTPSQITYAEAALLRVRRVGWTHVLIAYLGLLGLVIGGAIGIVDRALRQRRMRHDG